MAVKKKPGKVEFYLRKKSKSQKKSGGGNPDRVIKFHRPYHVLKLTMAAWLSRHHKCMINTVVQRRKYAQEELKRLAIPSTINRPSYALPGGNLRNATGRMLLYDYLNT